MEDREDRERDGAGEQGILAAGDPLGAGEQPEADGRGLSNTSSGNGEKPPKYQAPNAYFKAILMHVVHPHGNGCQRAAALTFKARRLQPSHASPDTA